MNAQIELMPGQGPHAVARLPTGVEDCPHCGGSGRRVTLRDGVDFVSRCECQDARQLVDLFNAAHLPRALGARTLEPRTADASGPDTFDPKHPSQRTAMGTVEAFVDLYPKRQGTGRGFALLGKPGVGKSHLLVGALRALIERHRAACRYVEFFHLLSELKEGYSQGKGELELIAPLCAIEVLAIDELGKGRGTEWEMYILDEIISRRYNAGKTTLFASNYTDRRETTLRSKSDLYRKTSDPAFMGRMTEETLDERVGVRIYSRLREMCDMVTMLGEDYRLTDHP